MPYSASAYQLLLSTPSDIPAEDERAVFEAVARWNVLHGKSFTAVVVPTHWRHHSAAEHGSRPQESLNKQLVEDTDILLALFWHRLGSDTGKAKSGTVEEIEEAESRGAYVAILRCRTAIPPTALDTDQIEKLDSFLDEIKPRSLVLDYDGPQELRERVDTILTRAVTTLGVMAEGVAESGSSSRTSPEQPPAQVWPRVERKDRVKTDSRGRVKSSNQWFLVLSNTGSEPARNVQHLIETSEGFEGEPPMESGESRGLEVLAPGTDVETQLFMHSGVADQALCTVTWEDSAGEHENTATLRFF